MFMFDKKSFANFLYFLLDDVRYNHGKWILYLEKDELPNTIEHFFEDELLGAKTFEEAIPNKKDRDIILNYLRIATLLDFYNSDEHNQTDTPDWLGFWHNIQQKQKAKLDEYLAINKSK